MNKYVETSLRGKISIKHGFSFKGEYFDSEGNYILLTPGNFKEEGGFKFDLAKAKFYKGEFPIEYICKKGDLVVAMTEQAEGLLGSMAIVPEDNRFLHNQRIGLVNVDENEIDIKYLYHLFNTKSVRSQVRLSSSGSKVKHTSPDRIYDVIVRLPNLATQQKIASVLSRLDTKIELNNRINAELEAMAKTLYDYWFVQFDFPNAEGKPYKSSGGAMVWSEELKREIPEGWEVKTLGDYAEVKKGDLITAKDAKYGNIKVIAAGVNYSYKHSEFNRDKNTITISGSGANAGFINFWREPIFASDCITVRGKTDAETLLLLQYLRFIQNYILSQSTGSAQPHVYPSDIKILNYIIPNNFLIEEFGRFIIPINNQMAINEQENQQLAQLRDWLLPMLMNGQAVVE